MRHPSRNLGARRKGYGIGGGYEKPRKKKETAPADSRSGKDYGAISHGGYYGAGTGIRPFSVGQATFEKEIDWYKNQFGEESTDYGKSE
ncbi:MAG TPA: hypothetical protein VFV34_17405 [Blastocatellia bacterium]|nr:hypothetical protein [Blastocatellia bacterium]